MLVVTSGKKYIDIDAYASCIAYAKLLNLKGIKAKAISTAQINESITPSLMKLTPKLDEHKPSKEDKYIVIDISNKDYFETFVREEKIIGIIDHHIGYEQYWKNKLKEKAQIEFIGSVATIIVELYEKENLMEQISKDLAILLMSAILDNTLNLKAKITTERDIIVYKKLEKIIKDETYPEKYFKECQLEINCNLKKAIENDTKIENINDILPPIFAQLTIWEKDRILENKQIIYETLNSIGTKWMLNLICIKDGKSYLIVKDIEVQDNIEKLFYEKFQNDIIKLDNVWLRKEIVKLSLKSQNQKNKC